MKKGILYELLVSISGRRNKLFRDSLKLLPGSLNSLASSLCPDLGTSGDIDHSSVKIEIWKEGKNFFYIF